MKYPIFFVAVAFILSGCSKIPEIIKDEDSNGGNSGQFVKYTIREGNHYCDQNDFRRVETADFRFMVRFDSSAIYYTQSANNQNDINKLFGFSDNNSNHHENSARIGWRWNNGSLSLFAYVYNNGHVVSEEISVIPIGADINCSIQVNGSVYLFTVNEETIQLPRTSGTVKAEGYQLYPYFGGDETAPHQINIWIREN